MCAEFACVDDTHYIHLGENADGKPCCSSIKLDEDGEPLGGWSCIGCGMWWPEMPEMEPEGLAALCRLPPRDDDDE